MKSKIANVLILIFLCKFSLAQLNKTYIEAVIINKTDSDIVIPYSIDDKSKFEIKISQDTFSYFLPPMKPDLKKHDFYTDFNPENVKIRPICFKKSKVKLFIKIPQIDNLNLPVILIVNFNDNTYVFTKKRKRYYLVHGKGKIFGR